MKTRMPTAEEVCNCLELLACEEVMSKKKLGKLVYRFTHIRKCKDRCGNMHDGWIQEFWIANELAEEMNK